MVQNCAGWVGDTREVGTNGEPEVFVLSRETLESLKEEWEWLTHGRPCRRGHVGGLVLPDRGCCYSLKVLSTRRADNVIGETGRCGDWWNGDRDLEVVGVGVRCNRFAEQGLLSAVEDFEIVILAKLEGGVEVLENRNP